MKNQLWVLPDHFHCEGWTAVVHRDVSIVVQPRLETEQVNITNSIFFIEPSLAAYGQNK
ncbi:hypothetical protein ACSF6V_16115 [Escherichia coli]|uniref:hypothetical protein n=1 Tax=Escherichia coli TaxID=562 RepID=UPI003EEDE27A